MNTQFQICGLVLLTVLLILYKKPQDFKVI